MSKTIKINECQRGNPLIPFITNHPIEYMANDHLKVDYELGKTTGALFLSLKYHKLHPNYIYERIKGVGNLYKLRVLFVLCDSADYRMGVREISRAAILLKMTLIITMSNEECARYMETFKSRERRTAESIKVKTGLLPIDRWHLILSSSIPSINKTDVLTLSLHFASFADAVCAREDELRSLVGFGEQKAARFVEAMQTCFDPEIFSTDDL